jgi:hypothetical protein
MSFIEVCRSSHNGGNSIKFSIMNSFLLSVLLYWFVSVGADSNDLAKRIVTSSGCAWCSVGPWKFDPGMSFNFSKRDLTAD